MRKTVTWEGIHVSALRSQTLSNDVCWVVTLFLCSSAASARNYKRTVNYPNISSATHPVPHTEDLPVPVPPQQYILDSDEEPTKKPGEDNLQHLRMLILLLIFNVTNSIELHKRN